MPKSRVLIVEDEPLLAMHLESIIEDLGHCVVGPYRNLHDGLAHARAAEIDFALLDFDLGNGVDALPIAESLTALGIPFVFTTGTPTAFVRERMPSATVIAKPITERALMDLLS